MSDTSQQPADGRQKRVEMSGAEPSPISPSPPYEQSSSSGHQDGSVRPAEAQKSKKEREPWGYEPIDNYALIGNLRTAALVGLKDTSIDFMCWPHFDSPSIFARLLDSQIGGHFSIAPTSPSTRVSAQYLPNSAVLRTKCLQEEGVVNIIDFMHRPSPNGVRPLTPWLIRRVEGVRGRVRVRMECFPAFNYARDAHEAEIIDGHEGCEAGVIFRSKDLSLTLDVLTWTDEELKLHDSLPPARAPISLDDGCERSKGLGVVSEWYIEEGQTVTFVLRDTPTENEPLREPITSMLADSLLKETLAYWASWIHKAQYNGRWREFVHRSAFTLKLLIFEPTGAICAAPTFSLPEAIGGGRNWDYRFTWVRDASFTIYALIRLGFVEEAGEYMRFIVGQLRKRKKDKDLQIMFRLDGGTELEEEELSHLDGYKGSKPVRIGNGAAGHVQLDVYGELMDAIYLYQKFGRPLAYETWRDVRDLVDFVVSTYDRPDSSIWEVRSKEQHYLYSKIMVWVAIDRGLRLADKRSLPCPNRLKWLEARDTLYEEIQTKGWNDKAQHYAQSYESPEVLDSACMIMPLVFFCDAGDPRFLSTLKRILRSPEKGGLTANSLVFRYDVAKAEDGIDESEEGAFNMCTLWTCEALARAGKYEPALLDRARKMFEEFQSYGNHVNLFSEEISRSGEALGNMPQAFTHVSAISTAYNLDRILGRRTGSS